MSPHRSKKSSKASKKSAKKSPKPNVETIQRRQRDRRVRTWLNQVEANNYIVDEEKDDCNDVYTFNGKYDADKHRGEAVEITDNGLDESDEDGGSECHSIASGPSFLHHATSKKLKTSWVLCSACQKLYEKAKRAKAPAKSKLPDNNPQSLTCDQWVLIKKWMPRKLPNARRKRLRHIQLNKSTGKCVGMGATSTCSRTHIFLQRNLRQRTTVLAKKERKNVRKRTRNDSQISRVAKQQRLQSNNCPEIVAISCLDDSPESCFSSGDCRSQVIKNQANTSQTAGVIPSSVTMETTKQKDVTAKREAPKKMCGFRDLLVQLRGNMIVREKR